MKVIGIDQSLTGTGIVCLKEGKLIAHKLISSKKKDMDRIIDIRDEIGSFMCRTEDTSPFDLIVMEGFSYGAHGRAVYDLGMLAGVLRMQFAVSKQDLLIIQPTMLKKFVTGKGNVHKDLVLMHVFKKWRVDFTEYKGNANNLADAFGLAMIGHTLLLFKKNTPLKLTKEQVAVLETIIKEKE